MGIRAVIFDMGGVVVELGPVSELAGAGVDPVDFWRDWLRSPAVRDFEMGRISVDEFGGRLASELEWTDDVDSLIERLTAWPRGLYPGARSLVAEVEQAGMTVGLLSNSNALHWNHQIDHELVQTMFPVRYLSFELGMVKPDRSVFDHVIADLGLRPEQILYFDDNSINVDAATLAGIDAVVVDGPPSARAVLEERGIL